MRFPYSVVADPLTFTAQAQEIKKLADQLDECHYEGLFWKITSSFRNVHSGNAYVIVRSQDAAMIKLMTDIKVQPLEEIIDL